VYSGGIRFYRPLLVGHIVEVEARLLHTGRTSMHISTHVRSGAPTSDHLELNTHCLSVFVLLNAEGQPSTVKNWVPQTHEDRALDEHAVALIGMRAEVDGGTH